jgi:nucleoside-diphosphate-sugar epimerase
VRALPQDHWLNKRVLVTGGAGFLASFVIDHLRALGCRHVVVPRSREFDLRHEAPTVRLIEIARPDTILHLAAVVGGIGANRENPGRLLYDNEISIRDQAQLIARVCGFKGTIEWDASKPDDQPRRCLDRSRAERLFGFKVRTTFESGLSKTIEWYREVGAQATLASHAA